MKNLRIVLTSLLWFAVLGCLVSGCTLKAKRERYEKRANEYYQQGKLDEARVEYLNLLRVDPTNIVGVRRLGEIWHSSGNPLEALRFLVTVRDQFPEDIDVRMKIAECSILIGHRDDARKEALEVVKRDPAHAEALQVLADTAQTPADVDATQQMIEAASTVERASNHLATATLLLKRGDIKGGEKELEKALALDPKSVLAHLAMGNFAWSKPDLARAEVEFQAAVEVAGGMRSMARIQYADFKAKTKRTEEANATLKGIVSKAPDYLPAWLALGQIAADQGKYEEALAYIANIFGRDPDFFDARLLQATVWLAQGKVEQAEKALEDLDKRHPLVPPLKVQLARTYLRANKLNRAVPVLDAVVAANPNYLEAVLLQATVNLRRGSPEAAVSSMESLLQRRPNLLEPQLLLVEAYRSLARFEAAAYILERQIAANPEEASSYYLLGLVQRQRKQPTEARASFEKALSLAQDNFLYLSTLIDLDLTEKKWDVARQRIDAKEKEMPGSVFVPHLRARVLGAEGKWELAEQAVKSALAIDANFAPAEEFMVSASLALKKMPQALGQLEHMLSSSPKNANFLKTAALVCEQLKEFTKARDYYLRYLEVQPDDPLVLNNLAYLYLERLKQVDKANEVVRKARSLLPADPGIADTLGWVHFRQEDYPQALALINSAASQIGGNDEVQYHLGMANYMMGRLDAARTALEKAAAGKEEFPGKEDIQPRLALMDQAASKSASSESLLPLLERFPGDLLVHQRLGEAYEREGQTAKAAAEYEQMSQKNAKLLSPLLNVARLNAGTLGNRDKALEYAKKAKQLAPNEPAVSAILGKLAFDTGDHVWAYSLLQEASRSLTNEPAVLLNLAWSSYSVGKIGEAEQTMQRVVSAFPNSPQEGDAKAFLVMVALEKQPERLQEMEGEINKVLANDPAYAPALVAQAALQEQRRNFKAAAEAYEAIHRRFPEFAPVTKRLAVLYFGQLGNREKARELGMKARTSLPDDSQLAALLGAISFELKDYVYAIQLLQDSSRSKPLEAKELYYMGMAYLETKNPSKARELLTQSLEAGLGDPLAAEARGALERTGK